MERCSRKKSIIFLIDGFSNTWVEVEEIFATFCVQCLDEALLNLYSCNTNPDMHVFEKVFEHSGGGLRSQQNVVSISRCSLDWSWIEKPSFRVQFSWIIYFATLVCIPHDSPKIILYFENHSRFTMKPSYSCTIWCWLTTKRQSTPSNGKEHGFVVRQLFRNYCFHHHYFIATQCVQVKYLVNSILEKEASKDHAWSIVA